MGTLSPWNFIEYNELVDDDLIEQSVDLLKRRYGNMADWIKRNEPLFECPDCGDIDLDYLHNGIRCEKCEYFKEVKVPFAAQGGVGGARRLESIIKELFSLRMAEERKKQKPRKRDLRKFPYDIYKFGDVFTDEEREFLQKRFEQLLEQNKNGDQGADPTMIRSMVIKELQIQNMEREEATGHKVDRLKAKDIYNLYIDISKELKFTKETRENEDEQQALDRLISEDENLNRELNIDEEIEGHKQQLIKMREYKKEAKRLREEAGNPYG